MRAGGGWESESFGAAKAARRNSGGSFVSMGRQSRAASSSSVASGRRRKTVHEVRPHRPESHYQHRILQLQRVLYELNSAIAPSEQRLQAINGALKELDHHNEITHDEEIKCSADIILFQKLALSLAIDPSSEEVPLICAALEMVYRASRIAIAASFDEIGMTVLPLIMEIIQRPQQIAVYPQGQGILHDQHDWNQNSHDNFYAQSSYADQLQHDINQVSETMYKNPAEQQGLHTSDYQPQPNEFNRNENNEQTQGMYSDDYINFEDNSEYDTQNYRSNYNGYSMEANPELANLGEKLEQNNTNEDPNQDQNEKVRPLPNNEDDQEKMTDVDLISRFNEGIEEVKRTVNDAASAERPKSSPPLQTKTEPAEFDTKSQSSKLEDHFSNALNVGDVHYNHPQGDFQDSKSMSEMKPLPINITESIGPPESAMNKILKVLRYYSRVLSAMVPLAHFPGLLDALLHQIERCSVTDSFKDAERTEARVDAIAIIVNLACADDNKSTLIQDPKVLRAVINLARHDTSEKVREHATIVILNLSYANESKVKLANEPGLLAGLSELVCDSSPNTRKYAAASLFTLAGEAANSELIATHEGGIILEALRTILLKEPAEESRINAAEAIFFMTRSNSDIAISAIANHPLLLDSLAEAVISDHNADVRAFSARALEWLASNVHHPMTSHKELLGALVKASQWTKTSSIAESLKTQASLQENRQAMAKHPGLLGALAGLSLLEKSADAQTKSYAISAIERLSTDPANLPIMAKNSLIMTALTRASFSGAYQDQQEDDQMGSNTYLLKAALKNLAGYM